MLFISKKTLRQVKYFILISVTILVLFWISDNKDYILKKFYPTKYSEYVYKYSKQYNVDPYLVFSIMRVESSFNPNAESKSGAKGLMQVTDGTGEWVAKKIQLKDYSSDLLYEPEFNIMIGCWYLNNLQSQFNGNMMLALTAYNGGSGNVEKWLKNKEYSQTGESLDKIPFSETQKM
jgi:soluble lytic murein transglycosylase